MYPVILNLFTTAIPPNMPMSPAPLSILSLCLLVTTFVPIPESKAETMRRGVEVSMVAHRVSRERERERDARSWVRLGASPHLPPALTSTSRLSRSPLATMPPVSGSASGSPRLSQAPGLHIHSLSFSFAFHSIIPMIYCHTSHDTSAGLGW